MAILGFRKGEGTIGGDPHLLYYNRQSAYSLRPAREGTPGHDPCAPGLHHLCFRVVDEAAVDRAARELREAGGLQVPVPRQLSLSAAYYGNSLSSTKIERCAGFGKLSQ